MINSLSNDFSSPLLYEVVWREHVFLASGAAYPKAYSTHRYKESDHAQLNVVYGTIRYGRCSRNPLSGPLLFIYNNIYLYIYIY